MVLFVLVSVLLFEYISRYIIYNNWVLETTPELSSTRWKLQWEKTKTQPDVTVYAIDSFHPILGWYPLKNAQNIPVDRTFVNFNSEGIRGIKNYSKEKPQGKVRIVVVGDSFTFGEGVNDDETYPAQLESLQPDTEVFNLAVHGYGIDQMTLRLELDGFSFHPDIVIYAFIGDDLNRTYLNFRDYMKPKYELVNNQLYLVNAPLIPPSILVKRLQFRPALFDLFSLLYDRVALHDSENITIEPLVKAIWAKTVEDIKRHNAKPVFLFLPVLGEMIDTRLGYLKKENMMFEFCKSMKIICFSARPYLLRAYEQGVKFNLQSHYEAKTNSIIAEGLANDLMRSYFNERASEVDDRRD